LDKDNDLKELQKEHYQVRIQLQENLQISSRQEIDNCDKLQSLEEKHKKEMNKLIDEMQTNNYDNQPQR